MARNEDRARQRRAKRRGDDPEGKAPEDALTPASSQDPGDLGEPQRAEDASRGEVTGSPVDIGDPVTERADSDFTPPAGGEVVGGEVAAGGGPRFLRFLRASWAELRRVRWPDREQVAQGTAVTLGFVIIAGAFLGVADVVADRIVNLII